MLVRSGHKRATNARQMNPQMVKIYFFREREGPGGITFYIWLLNPPFLLKKNFGIGIE